MKFFNSRKDLRLKTSKVLIWSLSLFFLLFGFPVTQDFQSIPVAYAAVPAAPTITSIDTGSAMMKINFTYTAGVDTPTSYQYQLNSGAWTAKSPNDTTTPFSITGLTNGTTYTVAIRGVNATGNGTASANSTAKPVAMTAPTISSITAGNQQLTVNFTAGTGNLTNYDYTTNGGTSWTTLGTPQITSPIVITGLTNGTSYSVGLRPRDISGTGTASSYTSATPLSDIAAPTITAIDSGSAMVKISFTAGAGTPTNYDYTTNGTTWVTKVQLTRLHQLLLRALPTAPHIHL